MRAFRSLWRVMLGCALGAILASNAVASLTVELRLVGYPGNTVPITGPGGDPIVMEIWGVVTDGNGSLADDGLWKFYSAFRSSDGGLMLGDLSTAPSPGYGQAWIAGEAGSLGYQNDLEGVIDMSSPGHAGGNSDYHFLPGTGDGDLDIGHTDPAYPAPPWFGVQHAVGMQFKDAPFGGVPINEWHVATLSFESTAWGPEYDPAGPSGVTEIWVDPRQYQAALWTEDGTSKSNFLVTPPPPDDITDGDLLAGPPIILYIVSAAAAPAGAGGVVAPGGPPLVLDGMASTGSINWWGWDFDGDGTYEIEGVGEGVVEVTYEELKAMGLADGPHLAAMTVGWSASDPINTSTAEFTLTLVPEPATVALLAVGLVTLIRRRK